MTRSLRDVFTQLMLSPWLLAKMGQGNLLGPFLDLLDSVTQAKPPSVDRPCHNLDVVMLLVVLAGQPSLAVTDTSRSR